jgi:hypothetical protein
MATHAGIRVRPPPTAEEQAAADAILARVKLDADRETEQKVHTLPYPILPIIYYRYLLILSFCLFVSSHYIHMYKNDLVIRVMRGEPVERVPIWIHRQAGRYLPEFLEIRKKYTFLQLCETPELAREVTLQPLRVCQTFVSTLHE